MYTLTLVAKYIQILENGKIEEYLRMNKICCFFCLGNCILIGEFKPPMGMWEEKMDIFMWDGKSSLYFSSSILSHFHLFQDWSEISYIILGH